MLKSWLIGHAGATDQGLNDLSRLNTSSMSWTDLAGKLTSTRPLPRERPGFTSIDDKLYLLGGVDADGIDSRSFFFHLCT
jgi:hypothetical protein